MKALLTKQEKIDAYDWRSFEIIQRGSTMFTSELEFYLNPTFAYSPWIEMQWEPFSRNTKNTIFIHISRGVLFEGVAGDTAWRI